METFFKFFTYRWHDLDTVLVDTRGRQPVHLFEDDYRKLREFVAQNYPAWDEKSETLVEKLWTKFNERSWCRGFLLHEGGRRLIVSVKGKIPAADFAEIQERLPDGYNLLLERHEEVAIQRSAEPTEVPDHIKQKSW